MSEFWKIFITAIISVAGSATATWCIARIKMFSVIKDAIRAILRNEILNYYQQYKDKNYVPLYVKEALERTYKPYKFLGGNDVAEDKYEFLMAQPDEPKSGNSEP